jgi:hypothetical protein
LRDARRPVREPAGRVPGPRDQAGADNQGSGGEKFLHHPLAYGLERTVVALDILAIGLWKLRDWRRFVSAVTKVGIDRNRRDERVVGRGLDKQFCGGTHDPRHVTRRIKDSIPVTLSQGTKVSVAVTAEFLDSRPKTRVGAATVEQGDGVTASEGRIDKVASEKTCAT